MSLKRACAVLLGVWLCISLPVAHKWRNGMVYDDEFVLRGPLIHRPERILEVFGTHAMLAQGRDAIASVDTYRPISILSFFWDAYLAGTDTWSYHLTNHLAHLAVVGLLFALARELMPKASVAALAVSCLFFGLSPQLAEAHVWINGRSDPLATGFGLAGILLWRRALRANGKTGLALHALAGALFLMGLLCKEVILLLMPALLMWPETERVALGRRVLRSGALTIACLAYCGLRLQALHGVRAAGDVAHLVTAVRNLPILWADGLVELVIPTKLYLRSLRDEYRLVGTLSYCLICFGVALLTMLAFRARHRSKVASWSLIWFAGTLGPAALISALLWPGFGRYLYLPCVGLSLAICELFQQAQEWFARRQAQDPESGRRLLAGAKVLLAAYLVSHAFNLASVVLDYESDATLYPAILRDSPASPHGHGWVGLCAARAGHLDDAERLLSRALELGGPEAYYSLALIRIDLLQNDRAGAVEHARSALSQRDIKAGDAEAIHALLREGGLP